MKSLVIFLVVIALVALTAEAEAAAGRILEPTDLKSTADRIKDHGYPVEELTVQTGDGYILKLFRIPHSPKLNNKDDTEKPVVLVMHGLLSSSDGWILSGPDNGLAFLLADAGYDVWMGNNRGNTYSKDHADKSTLQRSFWDFSWHEFGIYDLPAMIDYALNATKQERLHFIGHSQGATAFFVMLSTIPLYNDKIKTSHMMAPVAYVNHSQSPVYPAFAPLLGEPSFLSWLLGSIEFLPNNFLIALLGSAVCHDHSPVQSICANALFLIYGWNSSHLNYTLLPEVSKTHPAGSSSSQLIHYSQEYKSGHFRQFDYGLLKNRIVYKRSTPPDYKIENISPVEPIQFYYSDNDALADVTDVLRLAAEMGDNVELHHVKYSDWNHMDFLWGVEAKDIVYDPIIRSANEYENRIAF